MAQAPHPRMHGLTHVGGGADPIPGLGDVLAPFGDGIQDIILSKSPVGLWKLDEASGTVAADSSGAGNNMTVPGSPFSYTAPSWGQTAGPPGTPAALFTTGSGTNDGARLAVTMPAGMTDDFSAGCWARINDVVGLELMGQGVPVHASGGGWTLIYDVVTGKFALKIGAAGYPLLSANNTSAVGNWYLFGVSRIAGTWTLYLDGLLQAATSTATPTAETATWLGDCGQPATNHGSRQTISWAFITDTPLSGADWANLHDTASSGGALDAGLVWTSNGTGGASWEPPTGGGAFDPATATSWWMPLVDSDGTCVLDSDGNLIPTLVTL